MQPNDHATHVGDTARLGEQIRAMNWPIVTAQRASRGAAAPAVAGEGESLIGVADFRGVEAELHAEPGEPAARRQRSRDLFHFAPVGYLVTDRWGVIREGNRAAAKLLNIDPLFLVNRPLAGFVVDDQRMAFRRRLMALGDRFELVEGWEVRLHPRRREPFDALLNAGIERDPAGRPVEIRWILQDFTDRRRAEEEARARQAELELRVRGRTAELEVALEAAAVAERRFRDLVHGLDAIVWEADVTTGRFTFVSRRGEEMLGYPVERWITEPGFWIERIHPADRESALDCRKRAVRNGGESAEFEYRVVAADGRVVWLRESARVVRDAHGQPTELRGMMINVSKRKKAERNLYHAKSELSARLADLIYLQELGGRLTNLAELREILEEVLGAITSVVGADRGVAMLVDRRRGDLIPAASLGLDDALLEQITGIPLGVGSTGTAAAERRPVAIDDIEGGSGHDPIVAALRERGPLGAYSTPLLSRAGEVLGVITVYFREAHRPPPHQLRLVELYARQAEPFVERTLELGAALAADGETRESLAVLGQELREAIVPIFHTMKGAPDVDPAAPERALDIVERHIRRLTELNGDLPAPGI